MPRQIVIADGNRGVRELLQELLEANGRHVCAQAENGSDAVQLTVDIIPEAVILDLGIPITNGFWQRGRSRNRFSCSRSSCSPFTIFQSLTSKQRNTASALR
jgi:DNA-binding NarL/FixJ family response regulator